MRGNAWVLLLWLGACGGPAMDTGEVAHRPIEAVGRDSAGVRILEHPAADLDRAPQIVLDSAPMAVFAGSAASAANDMYALTSLTLLGDGRAVGFDQNTSALVTLDPVSGQRTDRGRRGAGPGELGEFAEIVRLADDSLLIQDYANGRLAIATADTGIVRTLVPAGASSGTFIGLASNGSVLAMVTAFDPGHAADGRQETRLLLLEWSDGATAPDTAAAFPGAPYILEQVVQGEGPAGTTIARRISTIAFAAIPMLMQWGEAVLHAPADRWAVESYRLDGTLAQAIRIATVPARVDAVMLDRAVAATLAARAGGDAPIDSAAIRTHILGAPHAELVPAYERVALSPDGTIWVIDYRMPGDSGWVATAIDADGRILGRMARPTGEAPVAFGNDRVLLRDEDADGIVSLTFVRFSLP